MLMPFVAAGGNVVQMDERSRVVGMQAIVSHLFAERDITPLWNELMQRVTQDGTDASAMLDLATILHTLGRAEEARQVLRGAVSLKRDFCIVHGNGHGPRLLAFVTPGDFMANTPVDFLLADSDCVLWLHYVDADTTSLGDLPAHDVAFMAIGELSENVPVLNRMKALLADFPGPVMNNNPELIRNLTRDRVSAMLAGEPSILSPQTLRFSREELEAIASGEKSVSDTAPGLSFPLVVRPISTHAGNGMARVATAAQLAAWLQGETAPELYVAPFIDFRGPDLFYNKQRIVFIKGKAFASHTALSDDWIVHYLSAGMSQSGAKRAVERAWMEISTPTSPSGMPRPSRRSIVISASIILASTRPNCRTAVCWSLKSMWRWSSTAWIARTSTLTSRWRCAGCSTPSSMQCAAARPLAPPFASVQTMTRFWFAVP
jgi:hypothetical protein